MNLFKLTLPCTVLLAVTASAQSDKIARGKYLVEEVARCQECHTPKNAEGQFDQTKWLKGSTLNIQAIAEVKGWHKASPDITSTSRLFQRWGDAGLVKFLSTGLNPNGGPAGAPMPTYKMTQADAEAIVEYLKSLK
jgi:mono/diheme cytochrome c family protein